LLNNDTLSINQIHELLSLDYHFCIEFVNSQRKHKNSIFIWNYFERLIEEKIKELMFHEKEHNFEIIDYFVEDLFQETDLWESLK
jgi:hypothetical protein